MEKESTGLQKDAKTYLDAMRSGSFLNWTDSSYVVVAAAHCRNYRPLLHRRQAERGELPF